jgi:hypothetical protein
MSKIIIHTGCDYTLCGNGLWCDLLCGTPWECKYTQKAWKEQHPEWTFEKFKEEIKKDVPFGHYNKSD